MKNGALKGILQFILALAIVILLDKYYFTLLNMCHIKITTDSIKDILTLVKYLLEIAFVVIIYKGDIFAGKNKFKRSFLTSLIIALVTFVVMVVFTIIVQKICLSFDIKVATGFVNYFAWKVSFSSALIILIDCFIRPCLIVSIFVLGISNIISKEFTAILLSGISYFIYLYFLSKNINVYMIIPIVNILALAYLYKSTGNIYTCFVTFCIYNLCGGALLSYIS